MSQAGPIVATVRTTPPALVNGQRAELTQDAFGLRVATRPAAQPETYRVDFGALVGVAGNIVEIAGSATRTVRLNYIFVPKPTAQITLIGRKQSTASGVAASTTPTPVPLDSANAAATAVVTLYTAAPALGNLVGAIFSMVVGTSDVFRDFFGQNIVQQVVLRGVNETFALNIDAGATVRGYIEWTEE